MSKLHRYNLVWSPEGKTIAENVEAVTSRAAVRKAPHPYRKYPGEIYAVLLNPSSFCASISAEPGHLLLGGVKTHLSSRFETEQQARDLAKVLIEINAQAGRKVARVDIIGCEGTPEILASDTKEND